MRRDAQARPVSLSRWLIVLILVAWSAALAWAPSQDAGDGGVPPSIVAELNA